MFGWHSVKDYWFPEVRTLPGAILVLSAVLYPYVYLSARASFVQQSVCVLEVARTLGRTSAGAFWSVALPLARPALAAGVALALMETLNDLGAVQYLGVSTLTVSIYATWLQRSSLAGAAQIAAGRRSPISSPSRKKTGVKITTETYDGTLATIKAKIGGSTSPFDIVDLLGLRLDMLCRDGLLETDRQLDASPVPAARASARISSPAASIPAASRASPGRP